MPLWLIPLLIHLIGALPGLIQTAETAFSGTPGKSGAAKKQLLMQSAAAIVDGAGAFGYQPIAAHKDAILGTVSALTDATVSTLNTVNALKANPVANAGGPNE